jgi:hypothetical protein
LQFNTESIGINHRLTLKTNLHSTIENRKSFIMKFPIFLVLLFLLIGCKKEYDYSVEDTLFNCLVEVYEKQGIDLEKEMNLLESYLIEKGYLKDNHYDSYYNLLQSFQSKNDLTIEFDAIDYQKLATIEIDVVRFLDENKCLTDLSNDEISSSKVMKIMMEFSKMDFLDFNKYEVLNCYLKVLKPKDFENNYYRAQLLILIAQS